MIGAIIGDIVGSRFEFNNIKTKDFKLVNERSRMTDDSILTFAVMDWAVNANDYSDDLEAARFLQKWARLYPNAGYGGMFYQWKDMNNPRPYNSCGNGSAMRISSLGWLCKTEEELKEKVIKITSVTHNHPEGIKGALVTATMIFRALKGATKEELYKYAIEEYPEIKNLKYDELVRTYYHGAEICQVTMPQALYCFFISNDFEDCLRTTISIGGDCDTTSAISCAIAQAYYKYVPEECIKTLSGKMDNRMWNVLQAASRKCNTTDYSDIILGG